MQTILLQLERLRRHYEVAVRSYDEVSLLDLSHSLRIWAELKSVLPKIAPRFGTTRAFKTATPSRKVFREFRGIEFVFSYMPGGVITYASNGHIVEGCQRDGENTRLTVGATVTVKPDGAFELGKYYSVSAVFESPMDKVLNAENQTRCNYAQWMAAEVVRISYPTKIGELKAIAIPREMMVKRVANTLDGSHASAAAAVNGGENSFDPAVHYLLQYRIGGLPLPYFILLKIAQDILSIAPGLLHIDSRHGQSNPIIINSR